MPRDPAPLIGINGVLVEGERPYLKLATRYASAVLAAGGLPIALAPVGGPRDLERVLDRIDGLLLGGGDDFDMQRLGKGATHPAAELTPPAKQDYDFELARRALERGMPVLGVCYGMQLLGLLEGGDLYQHVPEDRPGAQEHRAGARHDVRIEPDTKLARLVDARALSVVSRHHQALSRVAAPWRVCARDGEGLIEAIERDEHPFALGVQWHPELAEEGSAHDRLFRGLVSAAALFAHGPHGAHARLARST